MNIICKLRQWSILPIMVIALLSHMGHSATGPCDIYQAGGTPCVAAFSTVRALYDSYDGKLYQVRRKSDNATKDIVPLSKGGIANSSIQDDFCSGSDCTISKIYDQSANHNDLTKAPGGDNDFGRADAIEADAKALPIYINGYKAYGVHIVDDFFGQHGTQVGYRNTTTVGVARGDEPETIYMVADGQYVSAGCCFNFGNALLVPAAGGYGTMESVYLGKVNWWTTGSGEGPWVMADLEVGVYSQGGIGNYSDADKTGNKVNSQSQSLTTPFVTAYLKGNSSNPVTVGGPFVLKGGDAQSGALTTMWNGDYPVKYFPMNRGGGIVLGVGGDNSSGGAGNFYEGVMTAGFATEAMDADIQANIVAARYGQSNTILIETVPAHRDTIFNGGFDQDVLGWTFNTWGGTAQGSIVNGEYKIDISVLGTANASIQLVQNGIILQQGKSYEVKFDAYASANRTLEANVEQDVNPWTSYLPSLKSFDLTTTKTSYSYTFTMTNATDSNGRVSFNAGASKTGLFLDNISIKEVPTPVHLSSISGKTVSDIVLRLHNAQLNVEFSAMQGDVITMTVLDLKGNTHRSASFRTTGGALQSWSFDLSGMPRGVYMITMNVGAKVVNRSLINYDN